MTEEQKQQNQLENQPENLTPSQPQPQQNPNNITTGQDSTKSPVEKLMPELNLSPNLLKFSQTSNGEFASLFAKIIIVIQLIFLLIVAVNFYLNLRLKAITDGVRVLENEFAGKQTVLTDLRSLNNRITLYKTVQEERILFSDYLAVVNSSAVPGVTFVRQNVQKGNIDLELKSSDALKIALLLSNFLEHEEVLEVILTSAELAVDSNSYDVDIQLVMTGAEVLEGPTIDSGDPLYEFNKEIYTDELD